MDTRFYARVAAASLIVGAMAGCTSGAHPGSVEVEVRTMAPGTQSSSYDVKISSRDGDVASSQEISVGSTYGVEGVPLGWVSVELTPGCKVESELTLESPTMRVVIDGNDCILTD